jgi:Flp pilus assembly pilin Flp
MMNLVKTFLADDRGQDLIEYTLLIAFLALGSAVFFHDAGGSVKAVWGVASNQLVNAATAAS